MLEEKMAEKLGDEGTVPCKAVLYCEHLLPGTMTNDKCLAANTSSRVPLPAYGSRSEACRGEGDIIIYQRRRRAKYWRIIYI